MWVIAGLEGRNDLAYIVTDEAEPEEGEGGREGGREGGVVDERV